MKEGLITSETARGITGRAGITGNKPSLILEEIAKLGLYDEPDRNVVFVDDGLARGGYGTMHDLYGDAKESLRRTKTRQVHLEAENGL